MIVCDRNLALAMLYEIVPSGSCYHIYHIYIIYICLSKSIEVTDGAMVCSLVSSSSDCGFESNCRLSRP